jgi:hypothetical protein
MSAVKFLERKGVVRFFGAALIVAPFANALMFMVLQKSKNNLLYQHLSFWKILTNGTPLHYALAISSLIIGSVMLKGSNKAWSYVLFLLGTHIFIQLMHLGENVRQNWLWGAFFVINAGIFIFIADQLVFKIKIPEQKVPANPIMTDRTTQTKSKKLQRVAIGFKGHGTWAELVEVNQVQIQVRKIATPPNDIQKRFVEFSFQKGVTLKAKYASDDGHNYYFTFINIKPHESNELNSWIDRNAS